MVNLNVPSGTTGSLARGASSALAFPPAPPGSASVTLEVVTGIDTFASTFSGWAPFPVGVKATASGFDGVADHDQEIAYTIDFGAGTGDTELFTWTNPNGIRTLNGRYAYKPLAYRAYEDAGAKTITVTARSKTGQTATAQITGIVASADTYFTNPDHVWFLDPDGDYSGAPASVGMFGTSFDAVTYDERRNHEVRVFIRGGKTVTHTTGVNQFWKGALIEGYGGQATIEGDELIDAWRAKFFKFKDIWRKGTYNPRFGTYTSDAGGIRTGGVPDSGSATEVALIRTKISGVRYGINIGHSYVGATVIQDCEVSDWWNIGIYGTALRHFGIVATSVMMTPGVYSDHQDNSNVLYPSGQRGPYLGPVRLGFDIYWCSFESVRLYNDCDGNSDGDITGQHTSQPLLRLEAAPNVGHFVCIDRLDGEGGSTLGSLSGTQNASQAPNVGSLLASSIYYMSSWPSSGGYCFEVRTGKALIENVIMVHSTTKTGSGKALSEAAVQMNLDANGASGVAPPEAYASRIRLRHFTVIAEADDISSAASVAVSDDDNQASLTDFKSENHLVHIPDAGVGTGISFEPGTHFVPGFIGLQVLGSPGTFNGSTAALAADAIKPVPTSTVALSDATEVSIWDFDHVLRPQDGTASNGALEPLA